MKGRKKKSPAVRPEAAAPFFARFLETQHGDAGAKPGPSRMTLKYPSDRDEIDDAYSPFNAEAAPTKAGPSAMTLKYPSDRDEIDIYSTLHGAAADAP